MVIDIMLEKILKSPEMFDLCLKPCNMLKEGIIKKYITITDTNKKILEIGCGIGNLSEIFPKESYIGIDINREYIDYAKKRFKRNFLLMSGDDINFKDNFFDYILLSTVLHHMGNALCKRVFKECSRVLKKDGRLLILEPEKPPISSFINFVISKLDRGKFIRTKAGYADLFRHIFDIERSGAYIPPFWKLYMVRHCYLYLKKKQ